MTANSLEWHEHTVYALNVTPVRRKNLEWMLGCHLRQPLNILMACVGLVVEECNYMGVKRLN